jgi:hypothetical protein
MEKSNRKMTLREKAFNGLPVSRSPLRFDRQSSQSFFKYMVFSLRPLPVP